jgi:Kef-type K+ transport system membrane component KefB
VDPDAALVLAVVTKEEYRSIVLVLAASSAAALLSRLHYRLVLPTVVVEIVLGILIGPEGLDFAQVDTYISFLANFGLAFLFFFAGLEVIEKHVPRQAVVRGSAGWAISILLGLAVGVVLEQAGVDAEWWVLGVALATTALGTLVPILIDAGVLGTPLGTAVLGTGVAGEFWPIVVISVFLTSVYGARVEILLLLGFAALVALAATVALKARPPRVLRVLQETVHTTGQAAVRLAVLTLAVLVLIAAQVGLEFVLGALAAGLVVGLVLDSPHGEIVRMRLEGIGFGFLIPIYFVVTGMQFDIDSLLTVDGLELAALFLALLFVVRGASSLLWAREVERRSNVALAFFGATGLPLIVAIVDIASDRGAVTDSVGASLIGAGMASVLLFPLLGVRIVGTRERPPSVPAMADAGDEY